LITPVKKVIEMYKNIVVSILLLFALNAVPTSSIKADPIAAAMIGQSVNSIIENLKSSINDTINNLDTMVNKRSFDMRTHLLVVLQNLDYVANNIGNNLFDNISKQQQQFLTNTQVILDQFKQGNLEQIAELRKLTGDMESALATLPLSKQFPIVREYSPSYIQQGASDSFDVSIIGSWIGSGEPELAFPNGKCDRKVKIDRNIKFSCGKEVIGNSVDKAQSVTAKLSVYGEKSFWESIKGWISDVEKKRIYEISITSVPHKMGNVEVLSVVEVDKTESKNRSESYSWPNGHCQGGRTACGTFNQTNADWKIDVSSISNSCKQSSKSRCLGVRNVTQSSFQVCGAVHNNGECVRVLGKTVAKDGRGHVWGGVSWREIRSYKVRENLNIGNRALKWSTDESFQLPANTISFQVKVKQLDGATVIADKIGDYGWFTISKDVSSSQLLVRPKKLEVALK
jgi:hypothetical protein